MRKSIWQGVKPWCVPLGLTLLIYILLRSVFLIGYVPSASMEPTLHEGSFILGLRLYSEPKVGDIIIFEKDGVLLVKRIAACPGDSVDHGRTNPSTGGNSADRTRGMLFRSRRQRPEFLGLTLLGAAICFWAADCCKADKFILPLFRQIAEGVFMRKPLSYLCNAAHLCVIYTVKSTV